jgi:hypothetical protein
MPRKSLITLAILTGILLLLLSYLKVYVIRGSGVTSPSFCIAVSERVYITTSSGKGANGGSQGAVGAGGL